MKIENLKEAAELQDRIDCLEDDIKTLKGEIECVKFHIENEWFEDDKDKHWPAYTTTIKLEEDAARDFSINKVLINLIGKNYSKKIILELLRIYEKDIRQARREVEKL